MISESKNIGRKGQLTVFLILGIIIVVLSFVYLGFKIQGNPLDKHTPDLADDIQNKIRSCIESYTENGLIKIGDQGGYITLPSKYLKTSFSNMGYSYWQGQVTLRSLREIENDLANYIDDNLADCVDFSSFPKAKIDAREPSTKVNIHRDKVGLTTIFPLKIEYDNDQIFTTKDPFQVSYNVRLGYIYDELRGILDKKASDSVVEPFLDLKENDYDLILLEYDQGTKQVYVFFDPWSDMEGKKYWFYAALAV